MLAQLRDELGDCEKALGRPPSYQELRGLPYLHVVVQEAFPLNHPILGRLPKSNPENEVKYRDVLTPKDITVSVSTYNICHNSKIFPDSYTSEPERWLNQDEARRLRKYINNFGRGTRSCVGMDAANIGIYLTLGRLFAPSAGFNLALYDTLFERDVIFYSDFFGAFPRKTSNHIRATVV